MPRKYQRRNLPKLPPGVRLPNEGSKCQTPASLKIDLHYAQLRVWERWNWERFARLAKFLNVTPGELASICGIRHAQLDSFERRDGLYVGLQSDRSGALVLTLLEAYVCKEYSKDVIENPFPNLAGGVTHA